MTITTTSSQISYVGDGASTVFAYPYAFIAPSDLKVYLNGVLQVAGYVAAGNPSIGGSGTFPNGTVTFAPAPGVGVVVLLAGEPDQLQSTSLPQNDPFPSKTVEKMIDKLTLLVQRLFGKFARAIVAPDGESGTSLTLPSASARANSLLSFDSSGNVIASAPVAGSATALAADLASSALPTKNSGQIGFLYSLGYGVGTIGRWLKDLALSTGATFIGTTLKDGLTLTTVAGAFAEVRTDIANTSFALNDLDAMQSFATDIAAGTAASAQAFGDSTMWGADPANLGVQVAIPPPAQLQNFVNTFNGNTALTVTNSAISGTTAAQMLAGTDGSGQTFATRVAASAARVILCNHGVNDAFGVNATTAAAYRANLISIVRIIRAAGKTPVLVTPHPCLTLGTFGSVARAEATARFAQIMREVAVNHGVILVDNNRWLALQLGMDGYLPLAILPDGVHGAQSTYSTCGNNMADAILGGQIPTLSTPGQRLPVSGASVRATGQTISPSTSSRLGVVQTSGTVSPQTMRIIFRTDLVGLDISLLHPIFSSGSANIAMTLDGAAVGFNFSQLSANFVATFWQDYETTFARNLPPGFHILIMTTSSVGAAGAFGLRARAPERPLLLLSTGAAATPMYRRLLSKKMELVSAAANTIAVFDDMPASRFLETVEIEWTGQMLVNSGLVIGGNVGSNGGAASAHQALIVGLQGGGLLNLWEASGVGTFAQVTQGAVDLSLASHLFRVQITNANPGQILFFVDDVQIGAAVNLGQPYFGGLIGLWKNVAAGRLTVTDVCRIFRT